MREVIKPSVCCTEHIRSSAHSWRSLVRLSLFYLVLASFLSLTIQAFPAAADTAAQAQAKAIKAAQEAAKKAAQEAAARAAAQAAALRAAQAAAQKAAQEAAKRAAQEAAARAAAQAAAQRAAQAAAQKAAQDAAKRAAQEAAAQKAAQAAAQKAAQEAAKRAAQQAATQKTTTPTATARPVTAPTPTPTTVKVPTTSAPPVKAPTSPQPVAPVTTPQPQEANNPTGAAGYKDGLDRNLPRDASHRDGIHSFAPGEFQKPERAAGDGPAKPDWAPDPGMLTAPRASSSIKHAEPVEELAKDLKAKLLGAAAPPPAAPKPASADVAKPALQPKSGAAPVAQPVTPAQPPRGEEILATGLSDKQVKVLGSLGVQTETVTMPSTGTSVQRIRVPTGMSSDQLKAALTKQMPLTPFVPNHRFIIFGGAAGDAPRTDGPASPSCEGETCFGQQLVHWSSALHACTKDVKVGIIDTSFDTSHPAFRTLKASHGQFLNGEAPSPLDWHGTAVLSELGGHPESGTPGLIPHAHFFLAAAFRTDESGNASTDTVRLLSALEWMEALGVQYVNMSFTGPRDDLIETTIRRMRKKGVVFIAAAGNQGPNAPPSYPAAYPEVIAVTAINRKGESYRSANRGSYIDVAAPGVDIPAALPNGKQGLRTGTSFAAPFVTAILAARMPRWQAAIDKGDVLTSVRIADLGPPGRDPIYGAGLALAPQQCGGTPASGVASNEGPGEQREPEVTPVFTPTLGGFAPASGLGFRPE